MRLPWNNLHWKFQWSNMVLYSEFNYYSEISFNFSWSRFLLNFLRNLQLRVVKKSFISFNLFVNVIILISQPSAISMNSRSKIPAIWQLSTCSTKFSSVQRSSKSKHTPKIPHFLPFGWVLLTGLPIPVQSTKGRRLLWCCVSVLAIQFPENAVPHFTVDHFSHTEKKSFANRCFFFCCEYEKHTNSNQSMPG